MVSNLLKIMVTFIFENTQRKVLVLAVKIGFFGAKPCPGPGAEFSNLVTSRVVYMSGTRKILSRFH